MRMAWKLSRAEMQFLGEKLRAASCEPKTTSQELFLVKLDARN